MLAASFMCLHTEAFTGQIIIDGINYSVITKGQVATVIKLSSGQYSGDIVIPSSIIVENVECRVTEIGEGAFEGCLKLKSVVIGNCVTTIGNKAFSGCSSLTSITIPNSVTSIVWDAFNGCSGLTSITIGNGVSSIGDRAFYGCSGLTSITIPNSVTSIGSFAFDGCSGLTSITIPEGVTGIGMGAFGHCKSLISINIPGSLTKIYDYTFENCIGLTNVYISEGVTSIGEGAFEYCSSLSSITIPNSLTYIGRLAFSSCHSLSTIILGKGITKIGEFSFSDCSELSDVYCLAEEVPQAYYSSSDINLNVFYKSYIEYATLHVPELSIVEYQRSAPWRLFGKIVALHDDMKQCATPTISYKDGKLMFQCETKDVEFVSEITDLDVKKYHGATISLTATYTINVYATKSGYYNSDVATATLCWIDANPQKEGIVNGVAQVNAHPILIQSCNGTLNIVGAEEGTDIVVYNTSGIIVGSTPAQNNATSISTGLKIGEVAIVKIGERSVKVLMR